METALNCSRGI